MKKQHTMSVEEYTKEFYRLRKLRKENPEEYKKWEKKHGVDNDDEPQVLAVPFG